MGEFIDDHAFGSSTIRPPVESDEPSAAPSGAAVWNGIMSQVEVNRLPGMPDGAAEILYLSQVYGYGRYLIGMPTPVDNWSLYE